MKKTLTLIFGIFFLVSLVSTTSVGTLDMTEGKVVYTPPEVSDAEIVCADCNLNVVGNVNVTGNLIVGGCIQYNCSDSCITLGTCI